MRPAFEQASYLAQVFRLRTLAKQALAQYPLHVETCRFLDHWENTTFQITANGGKRFLLRIHRNGYHTRAAILEELRWLRDLSRDAQLIVPRPVKSKPGQLLETVLLASVGVARHCSLLEWIEGRFIGKPVSPAHMQSLGGVIARLHQHARHKTVIERRYWDAEGLVGRNPKFGPIERLPGISPSAQRIVSDARHATLRQLRRLESTFPDKQGLIHADLHFGNVLLSGGRIAAIDFDDCGFGFLAYDLAVPLLSVRKEARKEFLAFKTALIDGYAREWKWDDDDEEILASLMTARRLAMLGWLNSRSDNPKLRAHLKTATADVVKYLRKK